MAKIRLTAVKDVYDQVIDILHSDGVIEIEQVEAEEKDLYRPDSKAEYWQTNVKFALDLLKDYQDEEKKSFLDKLKSAKQEVDNSDIEKLLSEFDYKKVVAELENLDKELNAAKNKVSQYNKEKKSLREWQGLPKLETQDLRFVVFYTGTVPVIHFEAFQKAVLDLGTSELIRINESENEIRLVLIASKDLETKLTELFETHDFKTVELDLNGAGDIDQRLTKLDELIGFDQKVMTEVQDKIKKFAPHLSKFQILYDYLTWKKEQDDASRKALVTGETVSLIGWLPQNNIADVSKHIDTVTDQYMIEELEIKEDENIPIVLSNPKAVTPFESVTEIYGAPLYNEPDPTIYLAPFFIVYFALCLTDAGYGILLSLLAFAALKLMKPKGSAKKLIQLLIAGGVATFVAGALFGGWFGIVIADLPNGIIKDAVNAVRIIDPVQNPMTVLIMSLILGFIQLVIGNLVGMFWKIRHGQVMDGILDSGVWALFLLMIGFWITVKVEVLPVSLITFANVVLLLGILMLVATQGRQHKNVFVKIGAGVASLYGLVGYLSDVLSYSRLLALGLSTGIIAMVVNLVADLFAGMIPFVGWLVWILIIVGGHLFNLIINVLGAFIHAGRLQYVEYFPKFLVGGGRRFKPLVKEAKYITIKS